MVFQSYAIWPHMTVRQNVGLPLRARGADAREAAKAIDRALALVGLADFGDRMATQLSGGQQQRVALARSIVRPSRVILLDEPLSNLDAKLRIAMRKELKALQRELGTTMIFVTHDQDEAMSLGDEIFVFHDGRILQQGEPQEVYHRPASRYVAEFFGKTNFVEAIATPDGSGPAQLANQPGRTGRHRRATRREVADRWSASSARKPGGSPTRRQAEDFAAACGSAPSSATGRNSWSTPRSARRPW